MMAMAEGDVARVAKAVAAEVVEQIGGSVIVELITWKMDGEGRDWMIQTEGRWVRVELRNQSGDGGRWMGNDTSLAMAAKNAFACMRADLAKRGE